MRESQGYYSLVQYSEFPERAEFVNIGVILFASAEPYVLAKFSQRPRRAEKAFNVHLGNHFKFLQESMESRIKLEFGSGWSKERIEQFVALRSGKVRLSPVRSILVKNPVELIEDLFQRLVGDVPNVRRGQRPSTKLAHAFKMCGVDKLLLKPEPVHLPGGVKIEAPFAYQNGSFNLIDAVSLAGDPDKALNRASPHMIEGELLYQETALANRKQLVVIGDEGDSQDSAFLDMVSAQMERHHVRFYTIDQIEPLVRDIRENYAIHH
ncbi:DUF3037 domain-containing protein [Mesorhizobium neociceri]|nr:DUF3037 domain-containing protein [Mesorhizobium neociceri]